MTVIELSYTLLMLLGAVVGAIKGFAMFGFLGAVGGVICGVALGFGTALALWFLVAVCLSIATGGPLFPPKDPPK